MRIFKTRQFARWAGKHGIDNMALIKAVEEIANGLIEADYGGSLFKKRIATRNRGKSGSIRALLACKVDDKAVFLYGFEKNERDNISAKEKSAYKLLTRAVLAFSNEEISERLKDQSLIEVFREQED